MASQALDPCEACGLVWALHGRILRQCSNAAGPHFESVSEAARVLRLRGALTAPTARKLAKVDAAFEILRQATRRSFEMILELLSTELDAAVATGILPLHFEAPDLVLRSASDEEAAADDTTERGMERAEDVRQSSVMNARAVYASAFGLRHLTSASHRDSFLQRCPVRFGFSFDGQAATEHVESRRATEALLSRAGGTCAFAHAARNTFRSKRDRLWHLFCPVLQNFGRQRALTASGVIIVPPPRTT